MEPFKRSTARDFRINTQLIDRVMEDDEEEMEGEEDDAPPQAKRFRKN